MHHAISGASTASRGYLRCCFEHRDRGFAIRALNGQPSRRDAADINRPHLGFPGLISIAQGTLAQTASIDTIGELVNSCASVQQTARDTA